MLDITREYGIILSERYWYAGRFFKLKTEEFNTYFKDASPLLKEGVTEIIKYDNLIGNDSDDFWLLPEDYVEKAFLKMFKALSYDGRDILIELYEKFSEFFFKNLRYDISEAEKMLQELEEVDEDTDEKQVLKLLRKFDATSCHIAKLSVYPRVLIESLSLLEFWRSSYDFSSQLREDIMYTLSFYDNFSLANAYSELLAKSNYDNYKRNGLFSPEERQEAYERGVSPELIVIEKMLTGKK